MNFRQDLGRNDSPVYVIAEVGVNHNGLMKLAYKHIDAAVAAKANAVKFQTFVTEFNQSSVHLDKNYLKWAKSLELSFDKFRQLAAYCRKAGIQFLSTPFELKSAAFLNELVPMYKIPSGEITNSPLLSMVASTGKPIILSTGMSNYDDVARAIKTIYTHRPKSEKKIPIASKYSCFTKRLILLHCVSQYPTPMEEENLLVMFTLSRRFKLPVGISDHTLGTEIPLAAAALGACVIEKHFTIDKKLSGPDHSLSLDPTELKYMVESVHNVCKALGNGVRSLSSGERKLIKVARKSLVATRDISKGETISKDLIYIMRPGSGISPNDINKVVGRRLLKNMKKDEMYNFNYLI